MLSLDACRALAAMGYGRGPWDTRTAAQREQDAEKARDELYGR